MGNLESTTLETGDEVNKESSVHLNIDDYAPSVNTPEEDNGILREQISANQLKNDNLQRKLEKLSLACLSDNLDLDPSVVFMLRSLIDQIDRKEKRIQELEKEGSTVTKFEENVHRQKQEKLIKNAKIANDLHKNAVDQQFEKQQEYERLLHKKEILVSKNENLKKILQTLFDSKSEK